ncbi:MAG: SCO family protein [Bacteroidetes bacterium]|nr:SCO family protein [Bacteroidota bacterium]
MRSRQTIIASICVWALLMSCHAKRSLPYYNDAVFTPDWQHGPQHRIPAFSFVDQNGSRVSDTSLRGRIYIANFFFTSCGSICPTMMKNLLRLQKTFPADRQIAFVSHTVAPWVDSLPRLKKYSEKYGFDARWHLVTGDKAAIYQLARKGYFAEEEPGYYKDSTEFLHTEHVLLIDTGGHIRGVYNGTLPLEIDRLIADTRQLKKETE